MYALQHALAASACPRFCVLLVLAPFSRFTRCCKTTTVLVKTAAVECLSTMLRGHQCVLVGSLVSRELLAPAWTADGNERAQPTTGPLEQAKTAENHNFFF